MNKKKNIALLFIIIILMIGILSITMAQSNNDGNVNDTIFESIDKIKYIDKKNNFFINDNFDKNNVSILSDNKFYYKIDISNNKILTSRIKDYAKYSSKKEKTLNEKDYDDISLDVVKKFYPDDYKNFSLVSKKNEDKKHEHYFQYMYIKKTDDGYNTGEVISFDLNYDGELLCTAIYEGNNYILK